MYAICAYIHVWENNFFSVRNINFYFSKPHPSGTALFTWKSYISVMNLDSSDVVPTLTQDSFFGPTYPPLYFDLPNFWEINYGTHSQNTEACDHGEEVISLTYSHSSNSNSKTPQTSISVTCPGTSVLMHIHTHVFCMT